MTAATFILIHKQPDDAAAAGAALKFFGWAYDKGDKMAEELDYVPMPKKVVGEIEKMWSTEIKDCGGKALYIGRHGGSLVMQCAVASDRPACRFHNRPLHDWLVRRPVDCFSRNDRSRRDVLFA